MIKHKQPRLKAFTKAAPVMSPRRPSYPKTLDAFDQVNQLANPPTNQANQASHMHLASSWFTGRSRLANTESAKPVAGLSGVKAGTSIHGDTECIYGARMHQAFHKETTGDSRFKSEVPL